MVKPINLAKKPPESSARINLMKKTENSPAIIVIGI